jgi:hypothetical protein
MRSIVPMAGLAYCPGGRSLYWGGWAPRLTDTDLALWPSAIAHELQKPGHAGDEYERVEKETGVFDPTDFISGSLFQALKAKCEAAASGIATIDAIEDAPLAIQAASPASGLFSFDKWSSMPILTDAIREAAGRPDWQRRFFLVPRAQVVNLHVTNGSVSSILVGVCQLRGRARLEHHRGNSFGIGVVPDGFDGAKPGCSSAHEHRGASASVCNRSCSAEAA